MVWFEGIGGSTPFGEDFLLMKPNINTIATIVKNTPKKILARETLYSEYVEDVPIANKSPMKARLTILYYIKQWKNIFAHIQPK
jgi:hypothetical protein